MPRRDRTSPQEAERLRHIMLEIIRAEGRAGMAKSAAREAVQQRMPDFSTAAIGNAFTALRRLGAIRGVGETKARVYIATTLASSAEIHAARQDAADIHTFRDLRSWPPRHRPRPAPPWMREEHQR